MLLVLALLMVLTLLLLILTLLLIRTLVQRQLGKTEHLLLRSWKSTGLRSHRIGDLRGRRARVRTSIGRRVRRVCTLPEVSRRVATRSTLRITMRGTLATPRTLAPRGGRRLSVTK